MFDQIVVKFNEGQWGVYSLAEARLAAHQLIEMWAQDKGGLSNADKIAEAHMKVNNNTDAFDIGMYMFFATRQGSIRRSQIGGDKISIWPILPIKGSRS